MVSPPAVVAATIAARKEPAPPSTVGSGLGVKVAADADGAATNKAAAANATVAAMASTGRLGAPRTSWRVQSIGGRYQRCRRGRSTAGVAGPQESRIVSVHAGSSLT